MNMQDRAEEWLPLDASGRWSGLAETTIRGVHHVTVPVTDVIRSRDWYASVLGFDPILDREEEDRVVEVTMAHPCGAMVRLRLAPDRARALAGFKVVTLSIGDELELDLWCDWLDSLQVGHTPMQPAHIGWAVTLEDPDGIGVGLQTSVAVSSES
jgi:catechol 2,3-dioxygenase-like lactoylglutathione lyase family enzyme